MSASDRKKPRFDRPAPDGPESTPAEPPQTPTATPPPKVDPDKLTLRAKPRPVRRINRRFLIAVAGGGMIVVSGATLIALDPPSLNNGEGVGPELIQTQNVPRPDGLEALPRRYSELPREPVPELGPPLPGDLGPVIIERERELGIEAPLPFRPSPEDDAERAECIRQARIAQQARESGVFFQRNSETANATIGATLGGEGFATPDAEGSVGSNPFNALSSGPSSTNAAARDPLELDRQSDPNLQGRKLDVVNAAVDADTLNPHALHDPVSPYQLMAGTIIPASLITGVNSDLPGQAIAQVTEHVYDTATGHHLLIPQGSRVIGRYDSVIAFGQSRALLVWHRIIRPDGSSVVIEDLPATDTAGYAGLADEVDAHTWRLLRSIVLSTMLNVSTELTLGDDESDLVEAIRESSQDSAGNVGQRITERDLNIQPTITIRPGWPLRIIVHKDLVLRPFRTVFP